MSAVRLGKARDGWSDGCRAWPRLSRPGSLRGSERAANAVSTGRYECAVRMVSAQRGERDSRWAAIPPDRGEVRLWGRVAATVGSPAWARAWAEAGRDNGRAGPNQAAAAWGTAANETLRKASAYFAQAELDRSVQALTAFTDAHREVYAVEPTCKVMPTALSTSRMCRANPPDPRPRGARHAQGTM